MEFHPGRMVGIVLGLVILATIFLVPFGSNSSSTLYGIVSPMFSNLGTVQNSGSAAPIAYTYVWVIAFILLVIAGLVGVFPLGTGVMGIVGMAMITVSGPLIYPSGSTFTYGTGFYLIWAASVVCLIASFWHGKKKQPSQPVSVNVTQTVTTAATTSGASSQAQVKCPACGTMNPAGSHKCSNCGKDLPASTSTGP